MPIKRDKTDILEELLQLREDYFFVERFQHLLPKTINHVANISSEYWNKETLRDLANELYSEEIVLASNATQGISNIHGLYPIHGALIVVDKLKEGDVENRLYLIAHIINVARHWREGIQRGFRQKKDGYVAYEKNLSVACRVARLIDYTWLEEFPELHGDSFTLHKKLDAFIADPEIKDDTYIKGLKRFFAYGLGINEPQKRKAKRAGFSKTKATNIQRQRPVDEAPNTSIDALRSSRLTFRQSAESDDHLRQSGLSLNEEKATTELLQSDQPIASKRGDSSLQAVYRARSQRQHQDKAAQLLPGRWEQLSPYDLYHLAHQLHGRKSRHDKRLACLVGLMLATGRGLDSVLSAHVVRDLRQVPQKIDDQALYVTSIAHEWCAGVFRPEGARKINNQWREAMRPTLEQLPLSISATCQTLIEPHARRAGMGVKKRSVPLFKESKRKRLKDEFARLLSAVSREAGARLTEKRLSLHLFNILNMGESDLAVACLITARMPTFGQQSPLYYYAPAVANLAQQYIAALQHIEQQLSVAFDADTRLKSVQPAIEPAMLKGYIGSQMVPTAHYVNELVAQMLEQQREVKKQPGLFQQWTAFHNAYTAYTIAMLMFCTGYRSIRDPLPRLSYISLSRGVIVIADKTDDHQSNARFLPLPPLMIEQFKAYMKHRRAILSRLGLYLGLNWETPFLFLDAYGKPQQANPARLESYLQWPQSPPLNINRHYLHTQLKECGCSAEIVDAFMGHWDMGQEPWAKYSSFCPRDYRQRITSRVEDIMREQGWAVMEGIAL